MSFYIGIDLTAAQLAASIARADAGPAASRIQIFDNTQPDGGAAAGVTPQAEIVLAKPCGAIVGGVLVLYPADPGGAMVLRTGIPRWGRWLSGDSKVMADGKTTDLDHDGDFKLAGGATAPGETSPTLYAGGLVLLGATSIG